MEESKEKIGSDLLNRMYGGVILSVEPYLTGFQIVTADSSNYYWQGRPEKVTQIVVRSHPDNAGRVWLSIRDKPSSTDSWPLDANDWIKLTILNLRHLRLLIVTDTDKVIIGMTD